MSKRDGLQADHLRAALDEAEDAKATKRLMVALAYKDGVDVTTLAERYSISQSTIYYWLARLENQLTEGPCGTNRDQGARQSSQRNRKPRWKRGRTVRPGTSATMPRKGRQNTCATGFRIPLTPSAPRRTSTGCFSNNPMLLSSK